MTWRDEFYKTLYCFLLVATTLTKQDLRIEVYLGLQFWRESNRHKKLRDHIFN